ncbi:hypothetical protein J3F83DRAFT_719859 [Trichoderma novae-zelandiae]
MNPWPVHQLVVLPCNCITLHVSHLGELITSSFSVPYEYRKCPFIPTYMRKGKVRVHGAESAPTASPNLSPAAPCHPPAVKIFPFHPYPWRPNFMFLGHAENLSISLCWEQLSLMTVTAVLRTYSSSPGRVKNSVQDGHMSGVARYCYCQAPGEPAEEPPNFRYRADITIHVDCHSEHPVSCPLFTCTSASSMSSSSLLATPEH